jgi:hypothetical protein
LDEGEKDVLANTSRQGPLQLSQHPVDFAMAPRSNGYRKQSGHLVIKRFGFMKAKVKLE